MVIMKTSIVLLIICLSFTLCSAVADDRFLQAVEAIKNGNLNGIKDIINGGNFGSSINHIHNNETLLSMAIQQGQRDIVNLLLQNGASVHLAIRTGDTTTETPLEIAAKHNHGEIAKELWKKGAKLPIHEGEERSPLYWAVQTGFESFARVLLSDNEFKRNINERFENDTTLLHHIVQRSVSQRAVELEKLLIKNGADINAIDKNGQSPIFYTTYRFKEDFAEVLINNSAIINGMDNDGLSPLHRAAQHGANAVAKLLIEAGVDVNQKTKYGETALHILAKSPKPSTYTAKVLVRLGIDYQAKDSWGKTAADYVDQTKPKNEALLEALNGSNALIPSTNIILISVLLIGIMINTRLQ